MLDEDAVGNQVFHFSAWGSDGYYLVTDRDVVAGKAQLLFVDTTFAHSVARFACAVAADKANPFPIPDFQLFNIQYGLDAVLLLNVQCI